MADIIVQAPAKLNLFLHVIGKRDDGYHNLQTLFQLINFYDELVFSSRCDDKIVVDCNAGIRATQNLCYRAAKMLAKAANIEKGANIRIHKNIPIGGGLGGGSTNAAATLLVLNDLWQCGLSITQLAELGLSLGADVPVFVRGHSAFAEGVGEQLQSVDLPKQAYLLVIPPVHVSTRDVFEHPDLPRNTSPITWSGHKADFGHNDCEGIVRKLYPAVDQAFASLAPFGQAKLSGTGATVFLAVEDTQQGEKIAKTLPEGFQTVVTHGINVGLK